MAAQIADGGDEILQGPRQPVQRRDNEGVACMHELQAGGELGSVGVAAGLLLGEDPPAPGGFEGVDLSFEFLPAGGDVRNRS
jgi:hypothetical protein